ALRLEPHPARLRASLRDRSGSTSLGSPAFVTRGSNGAGERRSSIARKGNAMPTRRDLLRSVALVPAAVLPLSLVTIDAALAQTVDLLKLFVPAAPGCGWDQTSRTID